MTDSGKGRLLVVDDEVPQLEALVFTLREAGFTVAGFSSPTKALFALDSEPFDILLTDLRMPEMNGLELLRAARERRADLMVIVMTGHGTIDTAVEAMKCGAFDYVLKPFKLNTILPVLERSLAVRRLRLENAELSRRVSQRTAELEAANKELEAFSYSISHDLRAPLRHIGGFAEILKEDFAPALPGEARMPIEKILDGVKKMEVLIEDLLRLSRLSRQSLSLTEVDLKAEAMEIAEELGKDQGDRRITVRIGDLPPVRADKGLIRQVLVNLLSNAFKFTGKKPAAEIDVGFTREGDETIYHVRDNGAGFDMRFGSKLFGVFQRMHKASEFPGTGIGLSIVSRIIQRHGGRVWVQAALDEGATFFFTLPSKER